MRTRPPSPRGSTWSTSGGSSSSPTRDCRTRCCPRTGPGARRPRCSRPRPPGSSPAPTASSRPASAPDRLRSMSDSPVLLDVTDGVGTITLNRPEAYNSLNVATKELLRDTVQQVADDPAVRCVVLTGSGKAFCTGQDLKEHIELLRNGGSDQLFTTVDQHYNPTVTALAGMAKPVI